MQITGTWLLLPAQLPWCGPCCSVIMHSDMDCMSLHTKPDGGEARPSLKNCRQDGSNSAYHLQHLGVVVRMRASLTPQLCMTALMAAPDVSCPAPSAQSLCYGEEVCCCVQLHALEAQQQEASPGASELAANVTDILLCIGTHITPDCHGMPCLIASTGLCLTLQRSQLRLLW